MINVGVDAHQGVVVLRPLDCFDVILSRFGWLKGRQVGRRGGDLGE